MNDGLPERIRAFVAMRLRAEVDAAITQFSRELATLGGDILWVRPENYHLTLRFLGPAVELSRLESFAPRLKELARHSSGFEVRARGCGCFPTLTRPRVIWIGLDSPELSAFAPKVEELCIETGFEPEPRPYAAHLTIGRVRRPGRLQALTQALKDAVGSDFGTSWISSFAIYRSIPGRGGAAYHKLWEFNVPD